MLFRCVSQFCSWFFICKLFRASTASYHKHVLILSRLIGTYVVNNINVVNNIKASPKVKYYVSVKEKMYKV
jgi:hypothetical protein